MLIGRDRGHFLLIFARRRAKLLLNDWPASCLATAFKRNCRKNGVFFFNIYNSLLKQIDINTANKLLSYIIIMLQLILPILIT